MKAILSLGMLLTAGAVAGALAQAPMEAIRGEVVQREDNTLQVKSATAQTRSIQCPIRSGSAFARRRRSTQYERARLSA